MLLMLAFTSLYHMNTTELVNKGQKTLESLPNNAVLPFPSFIRFRESHEVTLVWHKYWD